MRRARHGQRPTQRSPHATVGWAGWRPICSGGEALGADLLAWSEEFFGATVNGGYGQTELNVCIGNCASVYPIKPGSLGRALPGRTVAVLDEDGNPVVDQVGELVIDRHHPKTMLEHWRNPEGTAESSEATGCSPAACAARTRSSCCGLGTNPATSWPTRCAPTFAKGLAPHDVPREIVFVDDLPRTTTGKIMRRALRTT